MLSPCAAAIKEPGCFITWSSGSAQLCQRLWVWNLGVVTSRDSWGDWRSGTPNLGSQGAISNPAPAASWSQVVELAPTHPSPGANNNNWTNKPGFASGACYPAGHQGAQWHLGGSWAPILCPWRFQHPCSEWWHSLAGSEERGLRKAVPSQVWRVEASSKK